MSDPAKDQVRHRMAVHLHCHTPVEDCLTCDAARLVASLDPPEPDSAVFARIRADLATVETVAARARDEIQVALNFLSRDHGPQAPTLPDAAAGRTPGAPLDAPHARATGPDVSEQLEEAQTRLARIAAAHTELVAESRPRRFLGIGRSDALRQAVRVLAIAWHGHVPADPRAPLTTQSR